MVLMGNGVFEAKYQKDLLDETMTETKKGCLICLIVKRYCKLNLFFFSHTLPTVLINNWKSLK